MYMLIEMLTHISEGDTWCHNMGGSIFFVLWPQKINVQFIYWIQTLGMNMTQFT